MMVDEIDPFSADMFSEDKTFEKLRRQRETFQRPRYDPDRDPFLQRSPIFRDAVEEKDGGGTLSGVVQIIRKWADR
jgi:hypothetical protein